MAGAISASLAFHVLLFFVLTSTSIYYPVAGEVLQFDIFLMSPSYSALEAPPPAAVPGELSAAEEEPGHADVGGVNIEPPVLPALDKNVPLPAPQTADRADEEAPVYLVSARVAQTKQPAPPVTPPAPKKPAVLLPKAKPERDKDREKADEADESPSDAPATAPQTPQATEPEAPPTLPPEQVAPAMAEEPPPDEPSVIEQRLISEAADRRVKAAERREQEQRAADAAREKAEQQRQAAQNARRKSEQERPAREKAADERRAVARAQQENLAREREQATAKKAERERQTAEAKRQKAEQERLAQQKTAQEHLALERSRQDRLSRERAMRAAAKAERERQVAEAVGKVAQQQRLAKEKAGLALLDNLARTGARAAETVPEVTTGPRPAEKPPEAKGIIIPSIHGDLKLIIAEGDDLKLTVLFREFPKSRRNRALTRSEARREQKITPIVVKTKEKTHEAVIEKAREGIYVFSAESEQGKGATATFTLKIFESSTRERTAALGARTISGKTVLVKILMPEAILWDDESAFTGTLEDSDSVTKFNATTGLYWKEFLD